MVLSLPSTSVLVLLAAALGAQSYQWSPPRAAAALGKWGERAPFWGRSGTFQQIHETATMGATALSIRGMAMRPKSNTIKGRSWKLRITLSHTKVSVIKASRTYSANMGAQQTAVFGSATTFKTFSWKDFTRNGTKPAFTIPFSTPYSYVASRGNLLWEWRHKDASSVETMPMEATYATTQMGSLLLSIGAGCIPSNTGTRAWARMSTVRRTGSVTLFDAVVRLYRATGNAPAVAGIGLSPKTTSVGWCAPVTSPLVLVPSRTTGKGTVSFRIPIDRAAGMPPTLIYTQFAFSDPLKPGGIALSDIAVWRSPDIPGANGLYRAFTMSSSNGAERATSGFSTQGYGIVIGWLK